jgi:hypothetical protein
VAPPAIGNDVDESLLRFVHEQLRAELAGEADRGKTVESKLIAVGAIAPVSVTIILASVSFLSSNQIHAFTSASVIVLAVAALYIAVQFLRAMLAAVRGLSRMAYVAPTIAALLAADGDDLRQYLSRASNDLARRIEQHREATNQRVSQLALAHTSVLNAIGGLIVAIIVLSIIAVSESTK